MANSPQARKRARQQLKRRSNNFSQKSEMRTTYKKAIKAIESNELTTAQAAAKEATKKIDTLAGRDILHPNKAARMKSRMNARLKAIA